MPGECNGNPGYWVGKSDTVGTIADSITETVFFRLCKTLVSPEVFPDSSVSSEGILNRVNHHLSL